MNEITVSRAECQTGKPLHIMLKNGETYRITISNTVSDGGGWWISDTNVTPLDGSGTPSAGFVEMEDLLFHLNSAVFLPEGVGSPEKSSSKDVSVGTQEQQQVEGLSVIAWLLHYLKNAAVPGTKLVIAGHTDSSGDKAHNKKLSLFRSKSLYFILRGDQTAKNGWCDLFKSEKKNGITVRINEDIQHIIKWASRKQYQLTSVNGTTASADFWGETFDLYQKEIASFLQTDIKELQKEYRNSINWDSDVSTVGCGEQWPADQDYIDNEHNQSDRRVEILLIDPDDSITVTCTESSCEGKECAVYGNDENGNPRCSRSRLSMGDYNPSGPPANDGSTRHIAVQLLSPNYLPFVNVTCSLNNDEKKETDCNGYVEYANCAVSDNTVTLSSGAGSVTVSVPWISDSDPFHTVLVMNADKITGNNSSAFGIQIRLKSLGYDCGSIDGVIGSATNEALRLFQKENDLEITGTADEATKVLLSLKFGA